MSPITTAVPSGIITINVALTAVIQHETEGGFSASIPALAGCHTQGETLEEVRTNLQEAAEGWLEVAHEDGLSRD